MISDSERQSELNLDEIQTRIKSLTDSFSALVSDTHSSIKNLTPHLEETVAFVSPQSSPFSLQSFGFLNIQNDFIQNITQTLNNVTKLLAKAEQAKDLSFKLSEQIKSLSKKIEDKINDIEDFTKLTYIFKKYGLSLSVFGGTSVGFVLNSKSSYQSLFLGIN